MKKACSVIIGLFLLVLTTGAATNSVTLAWNASTDPVVAGYNVYYGGVSGAYTNHVDAGNTTNVTVVGLQPNVTYYFVATAYASWGMESPFSNEISYRLLPVSSPPPPGAMRVVWAPHKNWFKLMASNWLVLFGVGSSRRIRWRSYS